MRKEYFSQCMVAIYVVAEVLLFPEVWTDNFDVANAQILSSQSPPSSSPGTITDVPTIQITSHHDGQQVQTGELTIHGISSDNKEKNCQVYADVNDNTPMRNVTAANGETNDFSNWTFTYTDGYQLIGEGANELTAKISCFGVSSPSAPLSEWHTVNVSGITGTSDIVIIPVTPPSIPALSEGEQGDGQGEDGDEDGEDTNADGEGNLD